MAVAGIIVTFRSEFVVCLATISQKCEPNSIEFGTHLGHFLGVVAGVFHARCALNNFSVKRIPHLIFHLKCTDPQAVTMV